MRPRRGRDEPARQHVGQVLPDVGHVDLEATHPEAEQGIGQRSQVQSMAISPMDSGSRLSPAAADTVPMSAGRHAITCLKPYEGLVAKANVAAK